MRAIETFFFTAIGVSPDEASRAHLNGNPRLSRQSLSGAGFSNRRCCCRSSLLDKLCSQVSPLSPHGKRLRVYSSQGFSTFAARRFPSNFTINTSYHFSAADQQSAVDAKNTRNSRQDTKLYLELPLPVSKKHRKAARVAFSYC